MGSIKNKADERKQYSAGSSVQKPSEPEAEHSTANSQMTALVKTLQNTKATVNHEDMLEVWHCNEHYSSQKLCWCCIKFVLLGDENFCLQ